MSNTRWYKIYIQEYVKKEVIFWFITFISIAFVNTSLSVLYNILDNPCTLIQIRNTQTECDHTYVLNS